MYVTSVYVSVDGGNIAIDPKHLYQTLLVAGTCTIGLQTFSAYTQFLPHFSFGTKLLMQFAYKVNLLNHLPNFSYCVHSRQIEIHSSLMIKDGARMFGSEPLVWRCRL